MEFTIPIKTTGDLNRPAASWRGRMGQARRAKAQREMASLHTMSAICGHTFCAPKAKITLTRICPARNQLRGSDNLQASLKHVRDGIAMAFRGGKPGQKDDADEWIYKQEGIKNGLTYGVRVRVDSR